MGAADGGGLNRFLVREFLQRRHFDVVYPADEGGDFDPTGKVEDFAGDGSGRDSADRFAGGGAAAPLVVAKAVFVLVGVVGVGRAEFILHLGIRPRPLVAVGHCHGDRSAGGASFEHAGNDGDSVGLLAGSHDIALAGAAPVEFVLDVGLGQGKAGRTSVHDDAYAAAVAFAPSADSEQLAETIGHRG